MGQKTGSLEATDWYKTKVSRIAFAVILLTLAYVFGSRAIDTGSWWEYLGCLLALIFSARFLLGIFKK